MSEIQPLDDLTLYDPFEGMRFTMHRCFLCGTPTAPPQDTIPVFADWLMTRYNLRERQIKLLDMSIVQYQDLRIACCPRCRTQHVEPLEARMEAAAEKGVAGFREVDEQTLFLWLGKMFYGILVTELLTELDPLARPQYPLAENALLLRRFQAFFQPLQALRVPMEYDDFTPASIFILEADPREDTMPFEYDDDLSTMGFSIKLGNAVLVACLVDNGIIQQAMRRVYQDAYRPLHPVQIAEFKARVYYAAYILNVIPDYYPRAVRPGDTEVVLDTLIDDVTTSIFNPWENSAYGQSLLEMWKRWQIPLEEILRNPAEPLTFLYDADGQPQVLEHFPQKAG
ncbi:hypothetical protein HNQ93_000836 [Hymenobacter luteus]|uniref:Uncharacterized protein n=2 Tax=Hymenobacter TaxID=89966 RepID=A0A7W9SY13_9BACT|nr:MULTISPECIES: hypothetical protein [Hymenobacter]MBB4599684.1 hypothetical protein [Hymenobacter latericoloratus]MBB6058006.1 hypothetical protein [Hymenobacter luteus]